MKVLSVTNSLAGLLSAVSALALGGSGALANIVVTDAKIDKGILKVTGTSSTGTQVKLDDLAPVPISAIGRKWNYSVVYHPEDCIVDLKVIGAAGRMCRRSLRFAVRAASSRAARGRQRPSISKTIS